MIKERLHHEYWPSSVFYFPVFMYYLFTSARLMKLNYFTLVNPGLKAGGLCGFSKYESFKNVPKRYLPKMIMLRAGKKRDIPRLMKLKKISFPAILKPDSGERGMLVSKVNSLEEINKIREQHQLDFLLQEFVEGPLELGVFLIKNRKRWDISSLTSKKFLTIIGDGRSTLKKLIETEYRAKKFFSLKDIEESLVLEKNEAFLLEPIGNHSRGTQFVNECNHISKELTHTFQGVLKNLKGIKYCRLDLRTSSWEDLKNGDFKIMEINGVSAEPGHIYDPNVKLTDAYRDLFHHWKTMAEIAEEELKEGKTGERFTETLKVVSNHLLMKRNVKKTAERV